jgi:hypothetical protein
MFGCYNLRADQTPKGQAGWRFTLEIRRICPLFAGEFSSVPFSDPFEVSWDSQTCCRIEFFVEFNGSKPDGAV